jgi:hypothetical protein
VRGHDPASFDPTSSSFSRAAARLAAARWREYRGYASTPRGLLGLGTGTTWTARAELETKWSSECIARRRKPPVEPLPEPLPRGRR